PGAGPRPGSPPAPAPAANPPPARPAQPPPGPTRPSTGPERPPPATKDLPPLELESVRKAWPDLAGVVKGRLGWRLSTHLEPVAVVPSDILVIAPRPGYNSEADTYGTPAILETIRQGLHGLLQRPLKI